jgi:hypothetical protein
MNMLNVLEGGLDSASIRNLKLWVPSVPSKGALKVLVKILPIETSPLNSADDPLFSILS